MPMEYSDSTLTIDLAAIAENYSTLQKESSPAKCAAVVKANAYGLGIDKVAPILAKANCESFFVATLDEAIELRELLPEKTIYIFHGLRPGQENVLHENNLIPVLNDISQIETWSEFAKQSEQKLMAIIHIDTGMNRLGVSLDQIDNINTETLDIKFVMSHLACSNKDHPKNEEQLAILNKVKESFSDIPVSFANSSGIFLGSDYHFDMVRPGVSLYGVNPTPDQDNPMQDVVTLTSKILQIRTTSKSETVGYGATKEVSANTKLATIPVGYADGYMRSLSNNSSCYFGDTELPIVGRISMDMIVVDITQAPEREILPSSEVELIGRHVPVDLLARQAGTIGYEILTNLGKRYKRIYKGGS